MLQDTLSRLRRAAGLSQEQLAEQLDVTRQTISKWEGGHSTPDLEKLKALARIFGVSLDELTGQEPTEAPLQPDPLQPSVQPARSRVPGLVLSLAGLAVLLALLILSLAAPDRSAALNASSTVTLNGTGLLMLPAAGLTGVGLWLLLKKQ